MAGTPARIVTTASFMMKGIDVYDNVISVCSGWPIDNDERMMLDGLSWTAANI
jgi:hypothetical protein